MRTDDLSGDGGTGGWGNGWVGGTSWGELQLGAELRVAAHVVVGGVEVGLLLAQRQWLSYNDLAKHE